MVLMTALRKGIDPNTTGYVSQPLNLYTKYGPWKVQTYSQSYGGYMNLVRATLQSDNTVYAQLDLDVGPEAVRKTAYDMGIKTKLDGLPAEGLGGLTLGVSPLEMANAYATIASGGWRNEPIAVRRVVFPDGKPEEARKPKRVKAFPDGVTYEATKILQQNTQSGTGTKAPYNGCPVAGKTGTTDDFTDAWFIGFTPKLATAVWVGYPDSKVPMRGVHGIDVNGGSFPTEIWREYMRVAAGSDCSSFRPPKQPASFSPFSARSARESRSDRQYDYGSDRYDDGGGGGGDYNPDFYESAPQNAPPPGQVPSAPPAAPPPAAPDAIPSPGGADVGDDGSSG